VPGKAHQDTPFLLPLIPALILACATTYLWYQGAARLSHSMPFIPIFIGLLIGGIMRLGTRTVDFARILFAVVLTAGATLAGNSAIIDHGPLNRYLARTIEWGKYPNPDPLTLLSDYHGIATGSLGTAGVMFTGVIIAAALTSRTGK
jgi:hypothetical protein